MNIGKFFGRTTQPIHNKVKVHWSGKRFLNDESEGMRDNVANIFKNIEKGTQGVTFHITSDTCLTEFRMSAKKGGKKLKLPYIYCLDFHNSTIPDKNYNEIVRKGIYKNALVALGHFSQ